MICHNGNIVNNFVFLCTLQNHIYGTAEIIAANLPNSKRIAQVVGYDITTGMIISRVRSGSEAEKAGLRGGTRAYQYGTFNPQTIYLGGDIITAIDNITISKLADYYSALENKRPGDTVSVTVYRDKEYVTLTVTLEGNDTASTGKSI